MATACESARCRSSWRAGARRFTLFVVLFAPFVWYLVGCCVAKPHSQVFKGSKVHIMTGKVTTTLWMADEDIPNIQELIDDPYDESAV